MRASISGLYLVHSPLYLLFQYFYFIFSMYCVYMCEGVCVSVYVCVRICTFVGCPQRSEEGVVASEVGVTGSGELPMCAGS